MREILFRGKRLGDGEWIEGQLFIDDKKEKHEILIGFVNYRISWEVDPGTVGQYTGLNDKNGKQVFEGDILMDDRGKLFEVFFTEKSCSFMVKCRKAPNEWETGNYRIGKPCGDMMSVIGNVHDNPELLRGDGDD